MHLAPSGHMSDELDKVDEASDESFPASDPPGWGSSHASTNPEPRTWLQRLAGELRAKVRELRVVIHRP